jgi:hypothetical protein
MAILGFKLFHRYNKEPPKLPFWALRPFKGTKFLVTQMEEIGGFEKTICQAPNLFL